MSHSILALKRGTDGVTIIVLKSGCRTMSRPHGARFEPNDLLRGDSTMKKKTRHRKSYKWRKKCDSSPIAKGRRPKRAGRNPRKSKHLGGAGL